MILVLMLQQVPGVLTSSMLSLLRAAKLVRLQCADGLVLRLLRWFRRQSGEHGSWCR